MRNICTSIENTVKESRGLDSIETIKEEIKKEFAEFTMIDVAEDEQVPEEEILPINEDENDQDLAKKSISMHEENDNEGENAG